jgi:integrase
MATHLLLNARRNLWSLPDGEYRDARRLFFKVRNGGKARSFEFRYTAPDGSKKRLAIGPLASVTLADARKKAEKWNGWLLDHRDPAVEEKKEKAQALIDTGEAQTTVNVMIDRYKESKLRKRRFNTRKSAEQSFKIIRKGIGTMPAVMVTRKIIIDKLKLEEMWQERHVVAQQLMGHLKRIFEMVQAEFHLAENAGDKLRVLLPPSRDVHTVKHHPELPYSEVPALLKAVRDYKDRSTRKSGRRNVTYLMECVILTAVRPGEARQALWREIDWENNIWNVPPENRKTGDITGLIRPIPITKSLRLVLEEMRNRHGSRPDTPIFRSEDTGGHFHLGAIMKFIRWQLKWQERLTSHSCRNAFTGWAQNKLYDQRLIERQLDHLLEGDKESANQQKQNPKVRRAYQQDSLLEPRRRMMEAYDKHCSGGTGKVIDLQTAKQRTSS